jgi:phosphatidate cytidylyltransferase
MVEAQGSSAPARPRAQSELGLRVASSVVLGVVALLATYIGGWTFALFWLLAGGAVLFEWLGMTTAEPRTAFRIVVIGLLAAFSLAFFAGASTILLFSAALAAIIASVVLSRDGSSRAWAASGVAYAAVIAVVPPLVREHPRLGLVAILWMFAVVWTTDIAAFFAGRRFGGPKLWPRVSPKKTWSGFLGGLLGAVLAAVAVFAVAVRLGWDAPVGLGTVILLSALASVLSQLGDLGESAMKRRFGAKDSGRLIPGHGGVMDRLDGFWAVAALMGVLLAGTQTIRSEWAAGG